MSHALNLEKARKLWGILQVQSSMDTHQVKHIAAALDQAEEYGKQGFEAQQEEVEDLVYAMRKYLEDHACPKGHCSDRERFIDRLTKNRRPQ